MSDLIKREDAIKVARTNIYIKQDADAFVEDINAIPSADRPRGTYTDSNECEEWYGIVTKCNECGAEWQSEYCNYCPNCGCRMKGEDNVTE